jgi:uncharacterized LabA/DUF88 family protein
VFTPKTDKIASIAENHRVAVSQLDGLLNGTARVFIDYANVRPWSERTGWHIDCHRLKQLLDSFDAVKDVRLYWGTLEGDETSEKDIKAMSEWHYEVRTKPVKIMRLPIVAASISPQSIDIIKNFIRRPLLRKLEISDVEYLNNRLVQLNRAGTTFLEDRKCNFDVEIGVDMLLTHERNEADTYVLWSGDSDFADPVAQLLAAGRKVVLMTSTRCVSRELANLVPQGLFIYEINKIKNLICWNREVI